MNPAGIPAASASLRPAGTELLPEAGIVRLPVGTSLADAEHRLILATLEHCGGNKTRTAVVLGISLKTLYNRLNAWKAGHPPGAGTGSDR